ncbi:MAG TPA: glycosyltransferase family 9 protein [bacterium]|nr:glycosyltransferase family 9 protein [bacterium]
MRKSFDPVLLRLAERALIDRKEPASLSFGESLDGTRDILLLSAHELTDLLAIVPAARSLKRRFRLARVHVLASGQCAEVLAGRPEVFHVIQWNPGQDPILSVNFLRELRKLRAQPFDLAIFIDSGEDRRTRIVGALSGAKLRVGAHPESADPLLNLVVSMPSSKGYRPVQSLEFLSFLGIKREDLTPGWQVTDADRRYTERLLALRRWGRKGMLLGVDPAVGRQGVRPSPEKLAWIVEKIAESRPVVPLVLSDDLASAQVREFRSLLKTPPLEIPVRGIRDVLALTRCCDAFLSGNTNLFHLAVALGVPTMGFFSRSDDERWTPPNRDGTRILRLRPGDPLTSENLIATLDSVIHPAAEEPLLPETWAEPGEAPLPAPAARRASPAAS